MIVHLKAFEGKHLFTNKAFKRCLLFLYICTICVPNGHIKKTFKKHKTHKSKKINWAHGIALGSSLLLLLNCNVASEMLPTFPFVEIKLCFFKQSTALQSFPLTSTPVENQGTWGKERATHNMWCKWSQARVIINSFCWKTKRETINCGWSNVVEKVAVTCGNCNYCSATSSQWALSDSHCPLLCTSHPGQTNIHEQIASEFVAWMVGSKFKRSLPLFGQCRCPHPQPIWKCV